MLDEPTQVQDDTLSKIRASAVIFALLCLGLSIVAVAYYACCALQEIGTAGTELANTSKGITAVVDRLNGPTGTITETDKLLLALKSTTVHADMVIAHEDRNLKELDNGASRFIADVDTVSGRLADTALATTEVARRASAAIDTANASIAAVQPLLEASTHTVNDLDGRLRDPKIDALLSHLDSTTAHVDGITADLQTSLHRITNPPPCTGRFCWLVTPAKILWNFRDAPEAGYWGAQLWNAVKR